MVTPMSAPQTKENTPLNHPKSMAEMTLWMAIRAALLGIVSAIEIYLDWKNRRNKSVN